MTVPLRLPPTLAALAWFTCAPWALGCAPRPAENPAASAETSEDVSGAAMRIVSIIPSAIELLFAVGAGDSVVARSVHCDFPPESRALPSIGSGLDPNLEAIFALRPTLVVASEMQADSPALRSLRAAGVDVLTLPDQSVAGVETALETLGARLDRVAEASVIVESMRSRLAAVRALPPFEPTPRVVVAIDTDPLFAAGAESWIGDLVAIAGGENVVAGVWVQVDDETLISLAPSHIVHGARAPEDLDEWQRFTTVPAVSDRRICAIDPDLIARPGPRVAEAAEQIGACLRR